MKIRLMIYIFFTGVYECKGKGLLLGCAFIADLYYWEKISQDCKEETTHCIFKDCLF